LLKKIATVEGGCKCYYILSLTTNEFKLTLAFLLWLLKKSNRQRLIQAALKLFAAQGMTETTTREIAELEVNEVTLFRHFGNKNNLLLAVIEEDSVFTHLGEALGQEAELISSVSQALLDYASAFTGVRTNPRVGAITHRRSRSVSSGNRQALGRAITQANRYTAQYLTTMITSTCRPICPSKN